MYVRTNLSLELLAFLLSPSWGLLKNSVETIYAIFGTLHIGSTSTMKPGSSTQEYNMTLMFALILRFLASCSYTLRVSCT